MPPAKLLHSYNKLPKYLSFRVLSDYPPPKIAHQQQCFAEVHGQCQRPAKPGHWT